MRESPRSSAPRRFRGAPGGTHSFVALVLLLLATARLQSLRGLTVTVTGQIEEDEHGSALSEAASLSSGTGEVQPPPLLAGAAAPRRPLRILMLGHDLTLTGAPLALLELGTHLRVREGGVLLALALPAARTPRSLACASRLHSTSCSAPCRPALARTRAMLSGAG